MLPAVQMACPLSFVPLTDPVVLVETGDVYDRQTLSQWLKKHDDCPLTGETGASCMWHKIALVHIALFSSSEWALLGAGGHAQHRHRQMRGQTCWVS